jgi:hypothetical protein
MANGDAASTEEMGSPPSVTFASGGLSWTRVWLPRLLSRIAKGLFTCAALAFVDAFYHVTVFRVLTAVFGSLSFLAWPLFILSYVLSLTQSAFHGSLEVSSGELVIIKKNMDRHVIPRARISGALVVEREMFGGFVPTVEIELTNGDVLTARLADPNAARAIVKALGFGAGGKRVHASLAKPTRRLLHPLFGVIAYALAIGVTIGGIVAINAATNNEGGWFEGMYALYPAVALVLYSGAMRLRRSPEVTVGDDGVMVKSGHRRRFIPRHEIKGVMAPGGKSLLIEMASGDVVTVHGTLLDDARRAAVARVIEERALPSAAAADRLAHYDRGGRELAAWREHLARAMNESSYRQNAATVDEAAAVLRSAHASPEQRVGAALALRIAGQPPSLIRVAVDGAVDQDTRHALEAVAEADDVEIEKALRRLAPRPDPR